MHRQNDMTLWLARCHWHQNETAIKKKQETKEEDKKGNKGSNSQTRKYIACFLPAVLLHHALTTHSHPLNQMHLRRGHPSATSCSTLHEHCLGLIQSTMFFLQTALFPASWDPLYPDWPLTKVIGRVLLDERWRLRKLQCSTYPSETTSRIPYSGARLKPCKTDGRQIGVSTVWLA